MRPFSLPFDAAAICLTAVFVLAGCNPTYNWREVRGSPIPYTVTLPGKPSSLSRPINLEGLQVTMTMTAAEVEGVTFAVGAAEVPDAVAAQRAILSMKTAMVRNINGTIRQEKTTATAPGVAMTEIEAVGASAPANGGRPKLLIARFVAKGNHVYQAVAVGTETSMPREAVDTFLSSFKPG